MSINHYQTSQLNPDHKNTSEFKQAQQLKVKQLQEMLHNLSSIKALSKSQSSQKAMHKMDLFLQSLGSHAPLDRLAHNALDVLHEIDPNMLSQQIDELTKPFPAESDAGYVERIQDDFMETVDALKNLGYSQEESEYALRLFPDVFKAYLYLFYSGTSYDKSHNAFDVSALDDVENMTVSELARLSFEIIEDKAKTPALQSKYQAFEMKAEINISSSSDCCFAMAEALADKDFDSVFELYKQHMGDWEALGDAINIEEIESKDAEDMTLGDLTKLYLYYGSYNGPKLDDYHPSLNHVQFKSSQSGNFTMGEINKLVTSQRVSFEKYMSTGPHGGRRPSQLEKFVQQMLGLSDAEKMEMIRAMIDKNGIESIKELQAILKLVGELGMAIDTSLLKDVQESIEEFLENIQDMVADPAQVVTLLESIQGMMQSPNFGFSEVSNSIDQQMQDISQLIGGASMSLQQAAGGQNPGMTMNGLNVSFVNPDEMTGDASIDGQDNDALAVDTFSQGASQSMKTRHHNDAAMLEGVQDAEAEELDSLARVEKIEDEELKAELFEKILRDVRDILEHVGQASNKFMLKRIEQYHKDQLSHVMDRVSDMKALESDGDTTVAPG